MNIKELDFDTFSTILTIMLTIMLPGLFIYAIVDIHNVEKHNEKFIKVHNCKEIGFTYGGYPSSNVTEYKCDDGYHHLRSSRY